MRSSNIGAMSQFRAQLSEDMAGHPSMMSPVEREILFRLARDYYQGKGKIIDAGVFMGASTRLFCHGLKANPASDAILAADPTPVATFEYGQLGAGMPRFFERHGIETDGLLDGTSFKPLFEKMIADVASMVDLRFGDVMEHTWGGEPVEICFLDLIKSIKINAHVFKTMIPHLLVGESILIQQDYFIDRLPFLKMSQEYLAPYFDYDGNAQSSGFFRLNKTIPDDVLAQAADPYSLPYDQQMDLIEQCGERVAQDPDRHFLVLLSKVIVAFEQNGVAAGDRELEELAERFPDVYHGRTQFHPRIKMGIKALEVDCGRARRQLRL